MSREKEINKCAKMIYENMGYRVEDSFDFSKAHHPQEKLCYILAVRTCNFWIDNFSSEKGKKNDKK